MSAVLPIPENKGWQAKIDIRFAWHTKKTVLASLKQLGPLRVQRPFYPEQDVCHVYLLHPPGGVVGGDRLDISVQSDEHSHALITTPGSTKFYRSAGDFAHVNQQLTVKQDSILEWFPQENILFPGAKIKVQTEIHLQENASFIGWDINCLGRPVNKELFDNGSLDAVLRVYRNEKPLLIERQRVFKQEHLSASAGLHEYPISGIFLCSDCEETHVEQARIIVEQLKTDFPIGITLIDGFLVLRILGHQTEAIQEIMIAVWQYLRPLITNKPAMLPRIWST